MKVTNVLVGPLFTNCYLLEKEGKVIIVDPGADAFQIKDKLHGKEVVAIFITHAHFDHIGALEELSFYSAPIFDFQKGEGFYHIGPFSFFIINTKGHSDDSITFYFEKEKMMFCGDFIFKNSIGRCDLGSGDISEMRKSIEKIKTYPNVTLFPGHGDKTTLDEEKKTNPYFLCQ